MLTSRRRVVRCAAVATLTLLLLLFLALNWSQPAGSEPEHRQTGHPRTGGGSGSGGGGGGGGGGKSRCPSGRFVTISASGRLGNKLCQYASLWALQRDDARARPAWVLPEMQRALAPLFTGLSLPTLPEACAKRSRQFRSENYRKFDETVSSQPRRPLLLTSFPCDLRRFHRHREALLHQLTLRPGVLQTAQRRLRGQTGALCRGPPACTYVGVHVRRTDYRAAIKWMYNGTLAGETYLRRALAICRRRYSRPVFIVSSDDLTWVRRRLRSPDVVIAGSQGPGSAGHDLALLAQCNHTIMTHGTYGFWAAYLARGDVFVPTGFGARDSYLGVVMKEKGVNVTVVPAF